MVRCLVGWMCRINKKEWEEMGLTDRCLVGWIETEMISFNWANCITLQGIWSWKQSIQKTGKEEEKITKRS